MGLTQSILDIAISNGEQNAATKITRVTVKVGDLATVVEEPLRMYFEFLGRGTIVEGAELVLERIPGVIRCASCGKESTVGEHEVFSCPLCSSLAVTLLSGREFYVDSLEIE